MGFVRIDEDRYRRIEAARDALTAAVASEQKFDLVIENYLELEETLLSLATRHMVLGGQTAQTIWVEKDLLNRRMLNLLAAARAYTDQVRQHVDVVPGLSERTKTALSQQYDGRLGFRTMEALRNYVQHRDVPVHSYAVLSKWIENRTKLGYSMAPALMPKELKGDRQFKQSVLSELEALGEQVPLMPLIREYVEGLSAAHETVRDGLKAPCEEWEAVFSAAKADYSRENEGESSIIGLAAVERSEEGKLLRPVYVLDRLAEYRGHLLKKNASLVNLARRFVSSDSTIVE
ncbi:hypothetical protein [Aquabacterium humicola]|uniref:hypothetical protein n=1 Tax=Aquabacterium humicola TaxID=3237377 RepID=UPI002543C255|nr:hypothetical protein [Rubrivivax pictus]